MKPQDNSNDQSVLLAALVGVAVFLAAYYVYVNLIAPTDHYVDGVRIVAQGNVKTDFQNIFSGKNVSIQLYADNLTDRTLTCETLTLAKSAIVLSTIGKKIFVSGLIAGTTCTSGNNTVVPCTHASLLVEKGPCNCMKVDNQGSQVIVEGSDTWLCANANKVGDTLGYELTG